MTTLFGESSLAAAMLASLTVVMIAVFYVQKRNDGLFKTLRWGVGLVAALLTVSSACLLAALLGDDFTLAYVAHHSEKSLAAVYKIAAFWAGQEGSLLFWAQVLGVMMVIMAWRGRRKNDAEEAITLGVMAAVTGFFTCVMIFAGNPFDLAERHASNGEGLNPALHPPMLFLGYAGFTAPFAIMLGALLTGRRDNQWVHAARPWMVYAWVVLTIGVVLGAEWAYVELGWGGYWAWDPVENASILPWFTGSALLHSAILQARRGIFKRWTASLVAASFFLCVFGTYLTRSGVIQSVHSFGESPIGKFFLVFLGVITVVSLGVLILRRDLLKPEHPLEDLFSREGFFLLSNVLLVLMTVATAVGTIFPILSGWFGATPVTVNAGFYNKVILPMALVVAALMATGPIVGQGAGSGMRAIRKLAGMAIAGSLAALTCMMLGYGSAWALFAAAVVAAVAAGVAIDLFTLLVSRTEKSLKSAVRVFAARPRHWGAQLAHLGLAAIIAGVTGSSVYGITDHQQLKPAAAGQPAVTGRVAGYTLTLKNFEQVRRPNHSAVVATVEVAQANGKTFTLQPERRFYDRGMEQGESASEVAIRYGLGTDVYLSLDGWDDGGKTVAIGAIVNPLVTWIWIGGALLALGGLVCLIPTQQRTQTVAEGQAAEQQAAPAPGKSDPAHRRSSRKRHHPSVATGS
jgi:cytochrome c-type biogenesis protein CcmF